MSCLVLKHGEFIKKLAENKKNKKEINHLIKNSKANEINSLSEVALNILNGSLPCTRHRKNILKKKLRDLRLLGDKKTANKSKKRVLMKGGGFLLSALIPVAISAITSLLNK